MTIFISLFRSLVGQLITDVFNNFNPIVYEVLEKETPVCAFPNNRKYLFEHFEFRYG